MVEVGEVIAEVIPLLLQPIRFGIGQRGKSWIRGS
jgi:hypothetical protein